MAPETVGSARQDRITDSAAQQGQIDRLLAHLRLGCECPYADEVADLIATLAPRSEVTGIHKDPATGGDDD